MTIVKPHPYRRLADLRFRQATGRSILEVITEHQINEAKRLLENKRLTIDGIADRCAYAYPSPPVRIGCGP